MPKVSDKSVSRGNGGNLLPGGQNTISGNLYDIVNDIKNLTVLDEFANHINFLDKYK